MYFAPWCSYCEWWRSCCLHVVLASPIHLPYHADFFHFWLYWRILCRCNVRFSLGPHVLFVLLLCTISNCPCLFIFYVSLCFYVFFFLPQNQTLWCASLCHRNIFPQRSSQFYCHLLYIQNRSPHRTHLVYLECSQDCFLEDRCTQSVCVSCSTCSFRLGRILPYSLGVYGVIQHIFSFVVFAKEGTEYSMSIACPSSSSPSSFASSSSQPSTSPDCSITLPSSPPSSSASPKPLYSQNKSATTLIARVRKMIMSTTSTSNSQSNDSQLTDHLWS